MNLFTGRQARPQASINSLKWLWLACQVFLFVSMIQTTYAEEATQVSCKSTYSAQTLIVPCVDVVTDEGITQIYSAIFQQVPDVKTMQFTLLQATENTVAEDSCRATYFLQDGKLKIPCINIIDSLHSSEIPLVSLTTQDPLSPLLFSIDEPEEKGDGSFAATCSNRDYCSDNNPFKISGYGGQCTAYVWGRVYEKFNIDLSPRGSAGTWFTGTVKDVTTGKVLLKGSSVQADSVAVWTGGKYGHVAYVESVANGIVTFTEANFSPTSTGYGKGYQGTKTLSIAAFENRGSLAIKGYIYLSAPKLELNTSTINPNPITKGLPVVVTAGIKNSGSAAFNGHIALALHATTGSFLSDVQILLNLECRYRSDE